MRQTARGLFQRNPRVRQAVGVLSEGPISPVIDEDLPGGKIEELDISRPAQHFEMIVYGFDHILAPEEKKKMEALFPEELPLVYLNAPTHSEN